MGLTEEPGLPQRYILEDSPIVDSTASGIEYYVEVYKAGQRFPEDPGLRRLRTNVPTSGLPTRHAGERYAMISFPLEIRDATLFQRIANELDGDSPTGWRMFVWDAARIQPDYVEDPEDDLFTLKQGRAYWLITRKTTILDTGQGTSTPTDSPFVLQLTPGWNQFANPFTFPVAWDSVTADPDVQDPWRWAGTEGNSGVLTQGVDVLVPFEGYWIWNDGTNMATLQFRPVAAPSAKPRPGRTEPAAWGPPGAWRVQIVARSDFGRDTFNFAGVARDAETGRDPYDQSDPPLSPGPAVSVYFPRSGWGPHTAFLATDIHPTNAEGDPGEYRWVFDVAGHFGTGGSPARIHLQFLGMDTVPAELDVVLVDRSLGRTQDLRDVPSYDFLTLRRSYENESSARFELRVGDDTSILGDGPRLPQRTRLLQNFPNPFRSGSVIRYDLAKAGNVLVDIYDVQGRLIKTLRFDQQEPGRYEVAWLGDNDLGQQVPPGVYFYRMQAPGYRETRRMIRIE